MQSLHDSMPNPVSTHEPQSIHLHLMMFVFEPSQADNPCGWQEWASAIAHPQREWGRGRKWMYGWRLTSVKVIRYLWLGSLYMFRPYRPDLSRYFTFKGTSCCLALLYYYLIPHCSASSSAAWIRCIKPLSMFLAHSDFFLIFWCDISLLSKDILFS